MKIGIIGGGASGMAAAITAARLGASVTLLEGGDRIGKKLLATGNGKCNFTNQKMDGTCFRSNTITDVSGYLQRFGTEDTLTFFSSLQMLYKEKNGYFYPASEQASTVLDVLRYEIERLSGHIQVLYNQKARSLTYQKDGTTKVLCGTESFVFDKVILACGSKAAPKTGSDGSGYQLLRSLKCGCHIEEPVPALVQLRCKENYLKAVSGVRVEGQVSLWIDGRFIASDIGEIQLTDYGISGIPVFQISRFASYGCLKGQRVQAILKVASGMDEPSFLKMLEERRKIFAERTMEEFCAGLYHKKICALFCKLSGISPEQRVKQVSEARFQQFVQLFLHFELQVEATNGFDMGQICAGGLSMEEIDEHFRMKKCPGIYVIGELLDVDGICGGYNLQWAWTGGVLAGRHAAGQQK